jgi:hypothetical protein
MAYRNPIHDRHQICSTVDAVVNAGHKAYDRSHMLPRLLPVSPDDIVGAEPESTRRIVLMLACALRVERARGRAGHWTYDLNRHIGLLQAMKAERQSLETRAKERVHSEPT